MPDAPGQAEKPWRFVVAGKRSRLVRLGIESFVEGIAEALFLLMVTRVAFGIFDDVDEIDMPGGVSFSINQGLWVAFFLVVVRLALALVSRWEAASLTTRAVADLRQSIAHSFLDASWKVQNDQPAGSLQELLTSYSTSASSLVTSINSIVLSSASLLALLGMAVAVEPLGALVLLLSVAVLGSLLRPIRSIVRRRARAAAEAGMELATSIGETSQLGMELHVFEVQNQAKDRITGRIIRASDEAQRAQFAASVVSPAYTGMAYIALVGGLAFVAVFGEADVTGLGAVMLLMLRSLSYGQGLQRGITGVTSGSPPIEELQRRLALFRSGRRVDGNRSIGRIRTIRASRVGFSYVAGQPALHDVSFEIGPSEIIGIIGPSGGGKTTLVQLLLGLRSTVEGEILVDGEPVASYARSEWARKVTFVPQESHLIVGSVADNIRFLRDDVTADDIERAARLAHLHDEIVAHPDGYRRALGPGAGSLSGGQQQRLCIARALVERPDLLILDEPTSALDPRSEHLVRSTLEQLGDEMTIIVIAHRLSTLNICDRIMVMQNGKIIAFDSPDNLRSSNTFYQEALAFSGVE